VEERLPPSVALQAHILSFVPSAATPEGPPVTSRQLEKPPADSALLKPEGPRGVENHVLRDVAFVPQSSMTTAAPFVRLLAVRHLALLSPVCTLKPCPALETPRRLKSKVGIRA
jgi:hypothetical protein